jgi:hypothetical protein
MSSSSKPRKGSCARDYEKKVLNLVHGSRHWPLGRKKDGASGRKTLLVKRVDHRCRDAHQEVSTVQYDGAGTANEEESSHGAVHPSAAIRVSGDGHYNVRFNWCRRREQNPRHRRRLYKVPTCHPATRREKPDCCGCSVDEVVCSICASERLLTGLGKPLVSDIMKSLCSRGGVAKMFTSSHHHETNGMIERFNRTLGVYLVKTVLTMETWPEYVAICVFRYNCSTHEATGQTPYKGMFGVESFEFDSGTDLRFQKNDEPANLPMRLAEVHKMLYDRSLAARTVAAQVYDKAVAESKYKVGDAVFVTHPPGLLEVRRKLQAFWRGPYLVDAKLIQVSYLLKDREGKVSRTHVNRLTSKKPDVKETQDPVHSRFPDSRRPL